MQIAVLYLLHKQREDLAAVTVGSLQKKLLTFGGYST